MNKILIVALMACTLSSCRNERIGIIEVVVLDKHFNKIKVVNQPDLIDQLNYLWSEFEPIAEMPNTQWSHRLDIKSEKLSGRWLYNREGFIAKLNKQLKPSFKVNDKDTLNKILLDI